MVREQGSIFPRNGALSARRPGASLDEPLPEQYAAEVTAQLLEGRKVMHEHGFTHRDLKPGVILMILLDGFSC